MSIPIAKWHEQMKAKFPEGSLTVSFVCPACRNVASIGDFKSEGIDENLAPQECILRTMDPAKCNWAAYGLFRGPVIVIAEDGHEIPVFEFAEKET